MRGALTGARRAEEGRGFQRSERRSAGVRGPIERALSDNARHPCPEGRMGASVSTQKGKHGPKAANDALAILPDLNTQSNAPQSDTSNEELGKRVR